MPIPESPRAAVAARESARSQRIKGDTHGNSIHVQGPFERSDGYRSEPLARSDDHHELGIEQHGGALQLDPPAAPSNCKSTYYRGGPRPDDDYTIVSWTDNSSNEDGFTLELWWRNQSGVWVLSWSENLAANYTAEAFGGRIPSGYRLRVRAFNASGNSAWSNWAH
jgi:hypothetical protein